jgi:hypothetical protein
MEWGGVWSVAVLNITGFPYFDYFFTLLMCFGLASVMVALVFDVLRGA